MAKRVLQVVEEPLPPDSRVVVSFGEAQRPVLVGGGRTTFTCPACRAVVARRVEPAAIAGLVLQCSSCCRHLALP